MSRGGWYSSRGHREIHNDDVGIQSLSQRDPFGTVGRFANHVEVALTTEHGLESRPDDRMVVHQNDANQVTGHIWNVA